jgi:hypothetical protein
MSRYATFARILLVVSLCLAIGMHWVVLQSVAWAHMIVTYAKSVSFEQAISNTFDGQHPCSLCKKITKNSASEKNRTVELSADKIDLFYKTAPALLYPPTDAVQLWPASLSYELSFARPPTPPPRPGSIS